MFADDAILALTCWRENRGGGYTGMQSVSNVIQNRAKKHGTSLYQECVKPLQFSSLTAKGDPELTLWPKPDDAQWLTAQQIAAQAVDGTLADLTMGADLYYNPDTIARDSNHKTIELPDGQTLAFPGSWNPAAVTYLTTIAGHAFFREK